MKLNKSIYRWSAAILVGLSVIATPAPAEAQFLKKLTKGLEKINKELDKAEKSAKQIRDKAKQNRNENRKAEQPTQRRDDRPAQAENLSARQDKAAAQKKTNRENSLDKAPYPYFTQNTRFVNKKVLFDNMKDVSEGIFTLGEYNREIGYSTYWGFWTVEGECLFPCIYEQFGEVPRFNSGACVVQIPNARPACPVILYADGHIKKLNHEWKQITQFHDGAAMVSEMGPKGINLFYIDTKGRKIWPHLNYHVPLTGGSAVVKMRPLREGLRAFYSNADKKWGFLDENGRIAIRPQYSEVRDFANGYALVFVPKDYSGGTPIFINKKGEKVVDVPYNAMTLQYATPVTDVSNGMFSVTVDQYETKYYDLTGKEIASYPGGGSGFSDGRAFVLDKKYGEQVYTINTNFDVVGKWPFSTTEFINNKPVFTESPYYTFDRFVAIDAYGLPLVKVRKSFSLNEELGQFSPDGYAKVRLEYKNPADRTKTYEYTGYVDITGQLKIVFCDDATAGGPWNEPPGPKPPVEPIKPIDLPDPPIRPLPPPPYELKPGRTKAAGPLDAEQKVYYDVKVIASPTEGGTVYGSGRYEYGDTLRVTGTAAKGWKLSTVECDRATSYTKTFNKFVVKGDMTITCYFTKEDELKDVPDGIFTGSLPDVGLPVYMQLGTGPDNRYTSGSEGFMAIITDDLGTLKESNKNKTASSSFNIFFVPINVVGTNEDGGKTYLYLNGGVFKYANLKLSDDTGLGMLVNPLWSLMLAFDGADSGELAPGNYRVEIIEGSPESGKFRFGNMQRKSSKYGWIAAGDDSFTRRLPGFFSRRYDRGLNAEFFSGMEMTKGDHRTISWEPGPDFFGGNDSLLQGFSRQLGEIYRSAVKDTPLSDYDFMQFSTDLDNHIFKAK